MLAAIIRKEATLILRDLGTLAALFGLPLVFVAVFCSIRMGPGGELAYALAVPANAVLFGFLLALTVALSFVEERRSGTWRRLLASPARRRDVLAGKLAPYLVVGGMQFAVLFGASALLFELRVAGSTAALAATSGAIVICAVALGLAIAAVVTGERQVGGVGLLCLLVLGLVGGTMVPRVLMPPWLQTLGLATPHGWALDSYHAIVIDGAGLAEVAGPIAALLGFAALFAGIGLVGFRVDRS